MRIACGLESFVVRWSAFEVEDVGLRTCVNVMLRVVTRTVRVFYSGAVVATQSSRSV
jgi:hypothetical protein